MAYCGPTPIIYSGNVQQYQTPIVDGVQVCKGLVPRDPKTHPVGYSKAAPAMQAVQMDLINPSEYPERLRDKIAGKALLSDYRMRGNNGQMIPSLDQNGQGYCWNYGPTIAMMVLRAFLGMPYVRLSGHANACMIKNFRDEGGWGAAGLERLMAIGCPSVDRWPEKSMSRANDKVETWTEAAMYRCTEGFMDLQAAIYDRNMSFNQLATCLLLSMPGVGDFNWWGHCVCILDLVDGASQLRYTRDEAGKLMSIKMFDAVWEMENPVTAGYGIRIWNSWTDNWGDKGMSILTGSQAVPDNCVALRVPVAA